MLVSLLNRPENRSPASDGVRPLIFCSNPGVDPKAFALGPVPRPRFASPISITRSIAPADAP